MRGTSNETVGTVLAIMTVASIAGCARPVELGPSADLRGVLDRHDLVDLTHTLESTFPFIPVTGITFPFALEPIASLETHGVAANAWRIHEHIGTQIDAPSHFAAGGVSMEALPPAQLIVPLAVIDFRQAAQANRDAVLSVGDIARWEAEHGQIQPGAVVALYTGWDRRLGDSSYVGLDTNGVKHFPGFGPEVIRYLLQQRNIWGVAVDTLSFDPGPDATYGAHRLLLGAGKWALEALANLDRVPPTGATAIIGAPKVRGATGGPARILALVPATPPLGTQLQGRWRSIGVEVVARGTKPVYLTREFTFSENRWTITITTFEDQTGRTPSARLQHSGRIEMGMPRPLARVIDADFHFEQRTVTPMNDDVARALTAASCGSAPSRTGVVQSVDRTGCEPLRVPSLDACRTEYDVVRVAGDRLFLGNRPTAGDLCDMSSRPLWPGPAALARVR